MLVASKAEETYKKIRQILAAAFKILNPDFAGTDDEVKIVEQHRRRVIQYEQQMLEAIQFNFLAPHIGCVLVQIGKTLGVDVDVMRAAWKFVEKM